MIPGTHKENCEGALAASLHRLVDQLEAEHREKIAKLRAENLSLRQQMNNVSREPGDAPPVALTSCPPTEDACDVPGAVPTLEIDLETHNGNTEPNGRRKSQQEAEPASRKCTSRRSSAGNAACEDKVSTSSKLEESNPGVAPKLSMRSSGRRSSDPDRRNSDVEEALDDVLAMNREVEAGPTLLQSKTEIDIDTKFLSPWRRRALDLVTWWFFDAVIGCVICANAITIGIETSHNVRGSQLPSSFQVVETSFLCIYVIELGLRFYAMGVQVLRSNWVKFDMFLVICGILDFFVMIFKVTMTGELDQIMLLRLMRLIRLVRAARLMVQFRTPFLLVQGMANSCGLMVWTMLIMMALVYVFALVGMELIRTTSEHGPEYEVIASERFSNLGNAMLTLCQFIMMDSVGAIYTPLISSRPELASYFGTFFAVGSIALMNLLTAIMVESSLRQAKEDAAAQKTWETLKRKQMEPRLRHMFAALDENGDGELEFDEVLRAAPQVQKGLRELCQMDDLVATFKMLDYDDGGTVDIEEFCDGVMRLQDGKSPPEMTRLLRQGSDTLRLVKEFIEMHSEAARESEEPRASLRASGRASADATASGKVVAWTGNPPAVPA